MFGLLIFTLCTAGLVYVLASNRRRVHPWPMTPAWASPPSPWSHPVGHGLRPGRYWLQHVLSELDATPAQERAIVDALDDAAGELRKLAAPVRAARKRVAAAFRNDALGEADVAQALDDPEQALAQARGVIARALTQVHAVLEERQRRSLARLLERHHAWA